MRSPIPTDPRQGVLFAEIIESRTTTDQPFTDPDGSWGTHIVRPAGKGWRVADYSRDRRTAWTRRFAVPIPSKRKVAHIRSNQAVRAIASHRLDFAGRDR